jgi:hypothetical protein
MEQPMLLKPSRVMVESLLAALSAAALVLTFLWPQWIEGLFGLEPDGGSGETEWGLAIVLAVATIVFIARAGQAWRFQRQQRAAALAR